MGKSKKSVNTDPTTTKPENTDKEKPDLSYEKIRGGLSAYQRKHSKAADK